MCQLFDVIVLSINRLLFDFVAMNLHIFWIFKFFAFVNNVKIGVLVASMKYFPSL